MLREALYQGRGLITNSTVEFQVCLSHLERCWHFSMCSISFSFSTETLAQQLDEAGQTCQKPSEKQPSKKGRTKGRNNRASEGREKGIVVIKRQLSVHIDFPVLCGVRLELSCSAPESLWRQRPLCQEERGGALTSVGVSWHCHTCYCMNTATFGLQCMMFVHNW